MGIGWRLWPERDGNFDLFLISADGGAEQRLTMHRGYDDGPDLLAGR